MNYNDRLSVLYNNRVNQIIDQRLWIMLFTPFHSPSVPMYLLYQCVY